MFNNDKKFDKVMELIDANMDYEFHLAAEYESRALGAEDKCNRTSEENEQLAREHLHEFLTYALLKQKILDATGDL